MNTQNPIVLFLVDDNEMYLKILKNFLVNHLKHKMVIHTFLTGEACLKKMKLNPSIVILDYYLNSNFKTAQNGISILKKIKSINAETSVIILSHQDNMEVAVDTMKSGAFDYVSKSEHAFVRIQNAINNIIKNIQLSRALKKYTELYYPEFSDNNLNEKNLVMSN